MANSRRTCACCKKSFAAETGIIRGTQFFASKDHQIAYAQKNIKSLAAKGRKMQAQEKTDDDKARSKAVKDLDRQSLKWQHARTQPVFNRMRVLEELLWFQYQGLEPTCISCGKGLGADQWCCGHLKTRGAQSNLRYDPLNTRIQHNTRCNMNLSGDIYGTKDTPGYIQGLKNRFGDSEGQAIIDYCESNTAPVKWSWQELEEFRSQCSAKIRELEKCLI